MNLRNCLVALQQSTLDEKEQEEVMDEVTTVLKTDEPQYRNLQQLTDKNDAAESTSTTSELTHTQHKTEITHNNFEAVVETVKRDEESDNKGDGRGEVTQMKEDSFGEQLPDASPSAVGNKTDWQAAKKSQVPTHTLDLIIMDKNFGTSEEDKVSGFFVLSHLWMNGYFRLG